MTNFNKTFGEFAAGESEDFMVMNWNYERDEENDSLISDLSTYIDPSKYNQIFADVSLSAQNFWVQTAVQMEVRRNISAKQIQNLKSWLNSPDCLDRFNEHKWNLLWESNASGSVSKW